MKAKDLPVQRHLPQGEVLLESGVPIPARRQRTAMTKLKEVAADMAVGDSILVSSEEVVGGVTTILEQKFGGKYSRKTYKTGPERGYTRIWRIE